MHNYVLGFEHSSLINLENYGTENQQGNKGIEKYDQPTGSNRYVQNTPSNKRKISILFNKYKMIEFIEYVP